MYLHEEIKHYTHQCLASMLNTLGRDVNTNFVDALINSMLVLHVFLKVYTVSLNQQTPFMLVEFFNPNDDCIEQQSKHWQILDFINVSQTFGWRKENYVNQNNTFHGTRFDKVVQETGH